MYRPLFPDISTPITWFAFIDDSGARSPLIEYMDRLPEQRRGKLKGRMVAWAQANNWLVVNPEIMHRLKDTSPPVYEIKSHQERVLFVRCGSDAIAFGGYTKKVNWGKREQAALDALLKFATLAAAECGSTRT
jgi:hypothetical protein